VKNTVQYRKPNVRGERDVRGAQNIPIAAPASIRLWRLLPALCLVGFAMEMFPDLREITHVKRCATRLASRVVIALRKAILRHFCMNRR